MGAIGRTIVLIPLILIAFGFGLRRSTPVHGPQFGRLVSATLSQGNIRSRRQDQETPSCLAGPRRVCNVLDYGATATGKVYDTCALQRAIEACKDGGCVYVPPGKYLTATLHLRSNIELHIDHHATIYGGPYQHDYPAQSELWYVILAESVDNVQITGGGTVDGQAEKFVVRDDPRKKVMVSWNATGDCSGDECRPRLIGFLNSTNILVQDVYLHQPAYWCLHIVRCNEVRIENITILGDFNIPNNDGIDIEDTNNTLIVNCHIDTGDDAICPKTYGGPLFNLTVTDTWIRSKSSAVKFGSATFHDFHGLRFERLTIVDSHRGLAVQLRDGGTISDVVFANIVMSTRYYDPSWWGRAEPIYITACPRSPATHVGSISDIHFINITATSENGVFLSGSPDNLIQGIYFQNISFSFTGTKDQRTERPETYHDYRPGCRGLVPHNSSGLFIEYASDLTFKDITVHWDPDLEWNSLFEFTPKSVGKLNLLNVVSTSDSPHFPFLSRV